MPFPILSNTEKIDARSDQRDVGASDLCGLGSDFTAFGWWTLGLNIGTLLSISIGLVLGSVQKKRSTGTRKKHP
jgi:hypothetical protein